LRWLLNNVGKSVLRLATQQGWQVGGVLLPSRQKKETRHHCAASLPQEALLLMPGQLRRATRKEDPSVQDRRCDNQVVALAPLHLRLPKVS
jgi:hypothetical protein